MSLAGSSSRDELSEVDELRANLASGVGLPWQRHSGQARICTDRATGHP